MVALMTVKKESNSKWEAWPCSPLAVEFISDILHSDCTSFGIFSRISHDFTHVFIATFMLLKRQKSNISYKRKLKEKYFGGVSSVRIQVKWTPLVFLMMFINKPATSVEQNLYLMRKTTTRGHLYVYFFTKMRKV